MGILGLFQGRGEAPAQSEDHLHPIMRALIEEKDKLKAIYDEMGPTNGHKNRAERQYLLGVAILQLQRVIRDLEILSKWMPS